MDLEWATFDLRTVAAALINHIIMISALTGVEECVLRFLQFLSEMCAERKMMLSGCPIFRPAHVFPLANAADFFSTFEARRDLIKEKGKKKETTTLSRCCDGLTRIVGTSSSGVSWQDLHDIFYKTSYDGSMCIAAGLLGSNLPLLSVKLMYQRNLTELKEENASLAHQIVVLKEQLTKRYRASESKNAIVASASDGNAADGLLLQVEAEKAKLDLDLTEKHRQMHESVLELVRSAEKQFKKQMRRAAYNAEKARRLKEELAKERAKEEAEQVQSYVELEHMRHEELLSKELERAFLMERRRRQAVRSVEALQKEKIEKELAAMDPARRKWMAPLRERARLFNLSEKENAARDPDGARALAQKRLVVKNRHDLRAKWVEVMFETAAQQHLLARDRMLQRNEARVSRDRQHIDYMQKIVDLTNPEVSHLVYRINDDQKDVLLPPKSDPNYAFLRKLLSLRQRKQHLPANNLTALYEFAQFNVIRSQCNSDAELVQRFCEIRYTNCIADYFRALIESGKINGILLGLLVRTYTSYACEEFVLQLFQVAVKTSNTSLMKALLSEVKGRMIDEFWSDIAPVDDLWLINLFDYLQPCSPEYVSKCVKFICLVGTISAMDVRILDMLAARVVPSLDFATKLIVHLCSNRIEPDSRTLLLIHLRTVLIHQCSKGSEIRAALKRFGAKLCNTRALTPEPYACVLKECMLLLHTPVS